MIEKFDENLLKQLYIPASDSRKGENGKVLIIGGSDLFHSPSFWAFEIVSKIVDMVYFSSTDLNNEILKSLKSKFINGIIVPRGRVEDYMKEADSILIGPGLPRDEGLEDGESGTKKITEELLGKFPDKKWVIDGGSLQVIKPEILPKTAIITPNAKEFIKIFDLRLKIEDLRNRHELISDLSNKYGFTILLKGEVDFVSNGEKTIRIEGGNAGMTKGGTGDVLAGLTAAFYAKNDALISASCASFINKKAGESLGERVGLYFNASDLVAEIPKIMNNWLTTEKNPL
jgi:hydroxyethylthiazole kinase-like uncharacterized protein yjeF